VQFFQSLTFCLQKCAFLFVFLLNDNHFQVESADKKVENKTGVVLERSYVLVRHEIASGQTNRRKQGGTEGARSLYPAVQSALAGFLPPRSPPRGSRSPAPPGHPHAGPPRCGKGLWAVGGRSSCRGGSVTAAGSPSPPGGVLCPGPPSREPPSPGGCGWETKGVSTAEPGRQRCCHLSRQPGNPHPRPGERGASPQPCRGKSLSAAGYRLAPPAGCRHGGQFAGVRPRPPHRRVAARRPPVAAALSHACSRPRAKAQPSHEAALPRSVASVGTGSRQKENRQGTGPDGAARAASPPSPGGSRPAAFVPVGARSGTRHSSTGRGNMRRVENRFPPARCPAARSGRPFPRPTRPGAGGAGGPAGPGICAPSPARARVATEPPRLPCVLGPRSRTQFSNTKAKATQLYRKPSRCLPRRQPAPTRRPGCATGRGPSAVTTAICRALKSFPATKSLRGTRPGSAPCPVAGRRRADPRGCPVPVWGGISPHPRAGTISGKGRWITTVDSAGSPAAPARVDARPRAGPPGPPRPVAATPGANAYTARRGRTPGCPPAAGTLPERPPVRAGPKRGGPGSKVAEEKKMRWAHARSLQLEGGRWPARHRRGKPDDSTPGTPRAGGTAGTSPASKRRASTAGAAEFSFISQTGPSKIKYQVSPSVFFFFKHWTNMYKIWTTWGIKPPGF